MPLIQCEDCGANVSDEAPSCLQCGRPIKRRIGAGRLIGTTIVLLVLLWILANSAGLLFSRG